MNTKQFSFITRILFVVLIVVGWSQQHDEKILLGKVTAFHAATTTTFSYYQQQQNQNKKQQQQQHVAFLTTATTKTIKNINRQETTGSSSNSRHSLRSSRTFLYSSTTDTNDSYDEICDVLVLGSGPAARAVATLLSSKLGKRKTSTTATTSTNNKYTPVIVCDKEYDRTWVPNYGVWVDEWDSIVQRYENEFDVKITGGNVGTAIDRLWNVTDCFFGGSFGIPMEEKLRIDRPYYRVDKDALRKSFTPSKEGGFDTAASSSSSSYRVIRSNHQSKAVGLNIFSPASSIVHDATGSTIRIPDRTVNGNGKDLTIRCQYIVDCTGHESQLMMKDVSSTVSPGYQIAYGAVVDIDESTATNPSTHCGPYDKEAMTLFDYRTDHYDDNNYNGNDKQSMQQKVQVAPTFMYVMPLKGNQIFVEETSLVARPAISFQECKDRCYTRLQYLGINVTKIHEEEYCYIPMGGTLPMKGQRIIPLGGAASMVHPATGYHLCRCLMGALDVSTVLCDALLAPTNTLNVDQVVASAYNALWTPENIRQRNFAVFGGEFLMKQNVVGLRGFFDGFFRLPMGMWGGFLAGWPGLPNNDYHDTWYKRMWFGLNFVSQLPPQVALDMLYSILQYSIMSEGWDLIQSVTPLFGQPDSYEYKRNMDRIGDIPAKDEARRMIMEAKLTNEIPVDFITTPTTTSTSTTDVTTSSSTKSDDFVTTPFPNSLSTIDSEEASMAGFQ